MKTLTQLLVAMLLGALVACEGSRDAPPAGPVTVSPQRVTLKAGASVSFSAQEGTTASKVLWSVEGDASSGTITSTGVYTAPARAGIYTVVATNALDPARGDTAEVTVIPGIDLSLTPVSPTVGTGGSVTFTARVTGATHPAVTWSVQEGKAGGSITSSGVYTAPTASGLYTIVATSVEDPSRKGSTLVKVDAVALTVSPNGITVDQGEQVGFSASVAGAADSAVIWNVEGGDAHGTLTEAGLYTAPTTAGTFTVSASSKADPTKKATATLLVRPVSVSIAAPTSRGLAPRGTTTFYATVTGTTVNKAVTWSVLGGGNNGTLTSEGVYTAPARAGTFSVVATSVADPSQKAEAQVTVAGAVSLQLTPATATLQQGATTTFQATVSGSSNQAVTWSVTGGGNNGTLTSEGVYTAPARAGTFSVVATSVADPSQKAEAQVTVSALSLRMNPATATIQQGAATQLSAAVSGSVNQAVRWNVPGGVNNGTVSSTGVYTAPSRAGTFSVVATSLSDPTQSAEALVTVTSVSVQISPGTATSRQGATTQFSATITGSTNKQVTWSVEGEGASGTITGTGVYTAPARTGTFSVVATSVTDPSQKATATVTVPAAQGLGYIDPPDTGWRWVKSPASSRNHLVLDLLGPSGQAGRGASLTLSVDAAQAQWSKVSATDAEYVTNRRFSLGDEPQLLKGTTRNGTLRVGVFQKGTSGPAVAYTGALLSVALDARSDPSPPAGARIPLSVVKALVLTQAGDSRPIDVAVGVLTSE